MKSVEQNLGKISFRELWRPFLARVPIKFKGAIAQKEIQWSTNMLKGMLTLWAAWFLGLVFFSDSQKELALRIPYTIIRLIVVAISIGVQYYLKRPNLRRETISLVTLFVAALYLGSYIAFSFFSLPIRTTWVTILPAAFILSTPRSGRAAVFSYACLLSAGLFIFHQPINTIWVISDILFGFVLIGGGLIIKDLWIKSIVLMLEQEEVQRLALQNEINILEAVEGFIPKGIRNKIRSGVANGEPISEVIKSMSQPREQHISVLYSDYRNYSRQSASIDFVQNELILSSQKIIEHSEDQNGIVQNRGDSIMATFLGEKREQNVIRALLAGIQASKSEFDRISAAGKSEPDRYMIITSGNAVFCSLGNDSRHEITIAGKPANLAARLDELTKNPYLKSEIIKHPSVLFDFETKSYLKASGLQINYEEIDLKNANLEVRTYSEEKRVFLLRHSPELIKTFSDYLTTSMSFKEAA